MYFKSSWRYKLSHQSRGGLWVQAKAEAAFHSWVRLVQMLGRGWMVGSDCCFPGTCGNCHWSLPMVLCLFSFPQEERFRLSLLSSKTQVCPYWGESGGPMSPRRSTAHVLEPGTFLLFGTFAEPWVAEQVCSEVPCREEQSQVSLHPAILRISFYAL